MGSKDRIQRLKENTRSNLLKAALKIVKQDGWHALSMRKIADRIDYTAPAIYEYFNSKESLIAELSGKGYRMLALKIRTAKNRQSDPKLQLEEMWLAYWKFAFTEKELYQAMFGVEVNCSLIRDGFSKAEEIALLFTAVIRQLMKGESVTEDMVSTKYFTLWSVVHGLVSINLVNKGQSDEINQSVLHEAIKGITASLT